MRRKILCRHKDERRTKKEKYYIYSKSMTYNDPIKLKLFRCNVPRKVPATESSSKVLLHAPRELRLYCQQQLTLQPKKKGAPPSLDQPLSLYHQPCRANHDWYLLRGRQNGARPTTHLVLGTSHGPFLWGFSPDLKAAILAAALSLSSITHLSCGSRAEDREREMVRTNWKKNNVR